MYRPRTTHGQGRNKVPTLTQESTKPGIFAALQQQLGLRLEATKGIVPALAIDQYPGGPNRCVSVSSLSARPSPVNWRVGIHNFTFEACSGFTRVTACKLAARPQGGLLSRGFDPASHPARPLGSYHV